MKISELLTMEVAGRILWALAAALFVAGVGAGTTGVTWFGLPARTTGLEKREEARDSLTKIWRQGMEGAMGEMSADQTAFYGEFSLFLEENNCVIRLLSEGQIPGRYDCKSESGESQ
jgi:hypothetical protein